MSGMTVIFKSVLIVSVLSLDAVAQYQIPPDARTEAVMRFEQLDKTMGKGKVQRLFRGCVPSSELDSVRLDWAELGAGWSEIDGVHLDSLLVSSEADLLNQADHCYYHFPLICNDRLLGTIRVQEDREEPGIYTSLDRIEPHNYGYRIDILEHRKAYPAADGYSISVIRYLHFGTYIVVFKSSKALSMAPTDRWGAQYLSMAPNEDNEYPFVPVTEAVPKIKEGYWNLGITSLKQRLDRAELVVEGAILHITKAFAITVDDSTYNFRPFRWEFNTGSIRINRVLLGELEGSASRRGMISVTFYAVHSRDEEYGKYHRGYPIIEEGDVGIWILRRASLIGGWTVFCRGCYLPMAHLPEVVDAISSGGE
jgi:hypothetical protein